jgi:uncharacterized protein YkwD
MPASTTTPRPSPRHPPLWAACVGLSALALVACGDELDAETWGDSAPVPFAQRGDEAPPPGDPDGPPQAGENGGDFWEDEPGNNPGDVTDPEPAPEPEPEPEPEPPAPVPDPDGWPEVLAAAEDEVLVLLNQMRENGGDCPSGYFGPRPPLRMDQALRRAARLHSQDMADNNYFSHTGRDGSSFSQRAVRAGYTGSPRGENIAAGNALAQATFTQWRNSDGHCRNMMGNHTEIGIGYATGPGQYRNYWTQKFGVR